MVSRVSEAKQFTDESIHLVQKAVQSTKTLAAVVRQPLVSKL